MTTPTAPPPGAESDTGDTASLKNRRRAAGGRKRSMLAPAKVPPADDADTAPPLPDAHPDMANALQRRQMTVLHPRERNQPTVAEAGGYVPPSLLRDYVVSEFNASEQLTPPGCRTPITRNLWSRGQHVRRDVYQTYLHTHPELAPHPVDEVELPDPDESDDLDGVETGEDAEDVEGEQGSGEPAAGDDQTV